MRTCLGMAIAGLCLAAGFSAARADDSHVLGTTVEMPYLIAPVVVDGDLVANAYISSVIEATTPAGTIVVRDRLPFIQDAFVRDVNGAPIGMASAPSTVDVAGLTRRLEADAVRIAGRNIVKAVRVVHLQLSPLNNAR